MSEPSELALPIDERGATWVVLRDLALRDETLSRVIRTYLVWDGPTSISRADDMGSMLPLLRLTPVIGPQSWYDPSSQKGWLTVNVVMGVMSPYILDAMGLWGALERAYYPLDLGRRLAIERQLIDAGAIDGQVQFSAPAVDPNPRLSDDGQFTMQGSMRIEVRRSLDP
jgi:hypothetical protein